MSDPIPLCPQKVSLGRLALKSPLFFGRSFAILCVIAKFRRVSHSLPSPLNGRGTIRNVRHVWSIPCTIPPIPSSRLLAFVVCCCETGFGLVCQCPEGKKARHFIISMPPHSFGGIAYQKHPDKKNWIGRQQGRPYPGLVTFKTFFLADSSCTSSARPARLLPRWLLHFLSPVAFAVSTSGY